MNDDERQATAAAYALGALGTDESRAFEAQLRDDAELRDLVREFQEVSAVLAEAAGDVEAPATLRARVLERARTEKVAALPRRRRAVMPALAWAAAAAGLLMAAVQTVRVRALSRQATELSAQYQAAAERRDLLERRQEAILDGKTKMYVMRPTAPGDSARFGAQVFWRRDRGTWLVHAFDLPRLPAGKVYQLWYVTPDAKISAGVFTVDDEGHGIAVLDVPPPAARAIVAAMSVEPAGGSSQPTGPIVLAGAVTD